MADGVRPIFRPRRPRILGWVYTRSPALAIASSSARGSGASADGGGGGGGGGC